MGRAGTIGLILLVGLMACVRASGTDSARWHVDPGPARAVAVDGAVHIIDAGSTNGVVTGEIEVKCAPIQEGCEYLLGKMRMRWHPVR